jgi:hypothetical protein
VQAAKLYPHDKVTVKGPTISKDKGAKKEGAGWGPCMDIPEHDTPSHASASLLRG